MKTDIKPGDTVRCIDSKPLSDTKIGPALTTGKIYTVKHKLTVDGHDHLDVGLPMKIAFVRCLETGVMLAEQPETATTPIYAHWCYPARFEKVA